MKSTPNRFRLSPRGAMVAIVSAAFSNPAFANTGKVDFTIGNVTVTDADGRGRPLTRGAEVKSGDKIVSSVDGRAQIRFSDGAYVSLQPNTEFDIKQYRYSGKTDGTESALFGLFRGAMRTVTGLVGRVNKNRYQITTTTATIGIRGTGGLIAIGPDGSTLVTGTSGIWTLSNKGGTIDIPAGSAGIAGANVNAPPQPASLGPVVPPPPPQSTLPPTIVQGDLLRTAGNAASIIPTSGPGRAVAFFGAGGINNSVIGGPAVATSSNAIFDSGGLLTQFDQSGAAPTTFTLAGTQVESGTDGFLSWGRWVGIALVNGTPVTLTADQGLHYVAGVPTPAASMPTGGTFTYNMIPNGATSPTFGNGSAAPGVLNSASLTGNFTTGAIAASVTATAGGSTFSGTANGTIGGSSFTGTGPATGSCSGACTLGVNGFFAGTGATRAGFVYQFGGVFVGGLPTTLNGAVALGR